MPNDNSLDIINEYKDQVRILINRPFFSPCDSATKKKYAARIKIMQRNLTIGCLLNIFFVFEKKVSLCLPMK